jgi:poly(A) polymerase
MKLGLTEVFLPELTPMVGCEQGNYHHLDVWNHSLLVLRNVGYRDLTLSLAALLHDVGKPPTRTIDDRGNTRFFSHEVVGASIAREILRRLKFPQREIDQVALLVKNHMRLGSSPEFSATAARRVLRDLDDQTDRLLELVEADAGALKVGVRALDLSQIRAKIEEVQKDTPVESLVSPLSGGQIMAITGLEAGPEIGRLKALLTDKVLDGELMPDDIEGAEQMLRTLQS